MKEKEKNKWEKEFRKFLIENNAYENYRGNLYKYEYKMHNDLSEVISPTVLTSIIPNNYIMFAFIWSDTKEGNEYWQNLHNKWNTKINNLKNI